MELSVLVEISKLFFPVIAIIGVCIAWQQFTANREKLRYDLFDRRFKVYDEIIRSMDEYLFGEDEVGRDQYRRFQTACNEAQFLLPSSVYETIEITRDKFSNLHKLRLRLKR